MAMISIQNEAILITCDDNGNSLALTDKKRGTRWVLDPQSLGYGRATIGTRQGDPETSPEVMVPASARSGNPVELIISYRAGEAALEISYSLRDDYAEARMLVPAS